MYKLGSESPNFIDRTGKKYFTNEGYWITIIEYFSSLNCTIEFENKCTIKNISFVQIKRGNVKNPYHPSVYGVGWVGEGLYKTEHKDRCTFEYQIWSGMIERCYSEKFQEKSPTYKGCTVIEEWKCFQNFAKWLTMNSSYHQQKWQFDKDILKKGNKLYSPKTCAFVPREINILTIKANKSRGGLPLGVRNMNNKFQARVSKFGKNICLGTFNTVDEAFNCYKFHKEQYIKEVADIWKDQIEPRVYKSLYEWKVEITD